MSQAAKKIYAEMDAYLAYMGKRPGQIWVTRKQKETLDKAAAAEAKKHGKKPVPVTGYNGIPLRIRG